MTKRQSFREKIEHITASLCSIEKSLQDKAKEEMNQGNLNLDSAIHFLRKNGYSISKSTIYKLTSRSEIPFHRFGNRLIFKIEELKEWCSLKTVSNDTEKQSVIAVSKSAQKRLV